MDVHLDLDLDFISCAVLFEALRDCDRSSSGMTSNVREPRSGIPANSVGVDV